MTIKLYSTKSYKINKMSTGMVLDFSRWYDNEWGYSNRCVDLAVFIGKAFNSGAKSTEKVGAKA